MTPAIYNLIGDYFRSRFGPLAGWAHTVLFAAELHDFQKVMSGEKSLVAEVSGRDEKEAPVKQDIKPQKANSKSTGEGNAQKKRKRASSDDEDQFERKVESAREDYASTSAADRVKSRKRTKTS